MNEGRYLRLKAVLERRQPDLTVLMEQVHKPHNFSAILRNCDATGVLTAHAVPPAEGLPLHANTAGGTHKWVSVLKHDSIDTAVDHLHADGLSVIAAHPGPHAVDFRRLDYTRPTCFVLGSELEGLSARALKLADHQVSIPMSGMVASLNVSVAAAVLLFEAGRQRQNARMYDVPRIAPAERERLLFEWSYPRIAAHLRRRGLPYPELLDDGHIADASALDPLKGRGT